MRVFSGDFPTLRGNAAQGLRSAEFMGSASKHALHEALVWAAIILGGFATFYYFDDLQALLGPEPGAALSRAEREESPAKPQSSAREVRLNADARGHFVIDAAVNDRPASFVADTGATLVVLTYEDAARLGLSPHRLDFSGLAQTANGVSRLAPVTLDRLRVKDITVRDVPAAVAEKGALANNLLGMSFRGRLKSFQMQGSELILVQ
jgi:aspartyl protease family protein